jgi:S-adenosylmethionine-diacylgycerolhomoserine-N-methlytransferase
MTGASARPSAELMNDIYSRQRHFYDLTRKYFLLGRDTLIARLEPPRGGSVLEIGCGTGRNLIAAARAYPNACFFGLDVSTAMLSTARANIRIAGLEDRIMLALGDAARFDAATLFRRKSFDRVFFSYSLSMIPPWQDAIGTAFDAVAEPGGRLLIVDFGELERLPPSFKALLVSWLGKFHVTPRGALQAELAAMVAEKGGELSFRSLYRDYARLAQIVR